MNQQSQAVDSANRIHTVMWHRDSLISSAPDGVWDPQESSYFHYFRDNLGNWHLNLEQPIAAQHYHEDALTIFEGLHDHYGIAETSDLLGLATDINGDFLESAAWYRQAIERFPAAAGTRSRWSDRPSSRSAGCGTSHSPAGCR